MHVLATARLSSIGRAMALRSEAWQRQGTAVQSEGYEVNCCAVALRSTDRQGEGKAKSSEAMALYCVVANGRAKEWQRKALM